MDIRMLVLVFLAVASPVSATPSKRQAFMEKKDAKLGETTYSGFSRRVPPEEEDEEEQIDAGKRGASEDSAAGGGAQHGKKNVRKLPSQTAIDAGKRGASLDSAVGGGAQRGNKKIRTQLLSHTASARAAGSKNMEKHADMQTPDKQPGNVQEQSASSTVKSFVTRVAVQLLFGLIYYMVIVSKYPMLMGEPTPAARKLQAIDEVSATCEVSIRTCICSWLCSGPRAAHTFYRAGVANYWCSLFGMSLCPCLVLCLANAFTDLNEKLGGEQRNMLMSCLCAWCCSCCVIAQDAESLDLITGVKTGFCGVYQSRDI